MTHGMQIIYFFMCLVWSVFGSSQARATADGPDYFRVVGTKGAGLILRAAGDAAAPRIGVIPAKAAGVRNRGCKGGLTPGEFKTATPERIHRARLSRWCLVEYKGIVGWAAGRYLAEAPPPVRPSFDCGVSGSPVAKLVCNDSALAALDRELAGLRGTNTDPADAGTCVDAGKADYGCVAQTYVSRIHDAHAARSRPRQGGAGSLSLGPFAYRCEGMEPSVSVVFTRGALAFASLRWDGSRRVLEQVRAASGARYAGQADGDGGEFEFWIKGAGARFTRPGVNAVTCRTEPGN